MARVLTVFYIKDVLRTFLLRPDRASVVPNEGTSMSSVSNDACIVDR